MGYRVAVSWERSKRVISAGLRITVAASCARAAWPAVAVPRSGVPISYKYAPPAQADATVRINHKPKPVTPAAIRTMQFPPSLYD